MKQLFFAATLTCLPLTASAACDGQDYFETLPAADLALIETRVAQTPYPQGLIWQATRGDDTATLIGTMHIYDPRLDAILAKTQQAVTAADILLVEAGPEEEAAMEAALTTNPALIFIADGPTLPELLDEDIWQALAAAARDRQIPAILAAKMQPWYLALTLSIPACAMLDLASGARGLDHMLIAEAKTAGVQIKALEPWDTLFTIMQDGTLEEQLEMLQLGLQPTELQTSMYVALLNSYFAEDIARIWEASRLAARDVPGMDPDRALALFVETEELLLNKRNRDWMDDIAAASAAHDQLVIAVGAAHLPGKQGVLRLMENDGWTITPLP